MGAGQGSPPKKGKGAVRVACVPVDMRNVSDSAKLRRGHLRPLVVTVPTQPSDIILMFRNMSHNSVNRRGHHPSRYHHLPLHPIKHMTKFLHGASRQHKFQCYVQHVLLK